MASLRHVAPANAIRLPRHVVTCPCCDTEFQPEPFMGKSIVECPGCDELVVLVTDGPSFGTSNIEAYRYGGRPPRMVN